MARRFLIAILACGSVAAATLIAPSPVEAQIQLPGAAMRSAPPPPSQSGDQNSGTPRSRYREAPVDYGKPVKLTPPNEASLSGDRLMHNGRRGSMQFSKSGQAVTISALELEGDVISRPGDTCKVTVPGAPFQAELVGTEEGLRKFRINAPACPFTFVVLDGALIATHKDSSVSTGLGAGTCEFKEKDCRGYLGGFWGPSGRSFNKNNARTIEKARGKSERDARANFRALLRAARGDKKRTRSVAADQAGFSARREERCRDFLREHVHGYCASRITEARAIQLGVRLNEMIKAREAEREDKRRQRAERRGR